MFREVPARAVAAAAVARRIAALPPHERLALPSTSDGTLSVYAARPAGRTAEELEGSFYDEGFDPVRHMLEQLPEDSIAMDAPYFDAKVGVRLLQLEVITERLSKQVMENHEEMVKGMLLVTELDRDLQLTSIICRNGRRFLSRATQEVTQDLLVAENVRKKQILLDVLPVLERVQQAVEMKSQLDRTTQEGNYALALQVCLECVLLLDDCSNLKAVMEVNHDLDEWLQRTIDKVDNVLLAVCHKFSAEKFETVLLTYLVLDDVSGLAEKVQSFYGQIVVSETHSVIRNILFEAQDSQVLMQKSRIQYNDLCSQLSEAQFKECLRRSLEVLFDLLSSYHQMMTCKQLMEFVAIPNQSIHKGNFRHLRVAKFDFEDRNEDASGGDTAGVEEIQDKSSGKVRDAMLSVARALERGRKTVWELSARRVAVLLSCDAFSTTSPHQFLQSLDWVNKFILAGEVFCGAEAMSLRAKLVKQSEKYYWTFHRQNLEVLLIMLEKEPWISTPSMRRLCLAGLVNGTSMVKTSRNGPERVGASYELKGIGIASMRTDESSVRVSFDDWLGKGNPFSDRRNLHESGTRVEDHRKASQIEKGRDEEVEDEDLLADFIDEDSQLPSRLRTDYRQKSAKIEHGDEGFMTLTSSAVSLLRYMDKYVKLIQILQPIVSEVFRGLCQLFELYFFTVFKVFGSRDCLTASLRSTLVRIAKGLEEQRIQIPTFSWLTSQSGSPTSSQLSSDLSPNSGGSVLLMSPGNLFALKECTVATQSLLSLSQILEKSCSHFMTILPQDAKAYMEQFFAQTVELVPELTIHVYKVVARLMLNIGGYVERIANARWELKELGMEHNGYVDLLLGEFKQYTNKLSQGNILKEVQEMMLDYGVDVLAETILEGLSRVKRCNNEGRALMSLDLQVLINGLHHLASSRAKSNLTIVETYIKAFYLPETEYLHWIRAHPEYSKTQVTGLINVVASTYNWKRKTKTDFLEKIEAGDL